VGLRATFRSAIDDGEGAVDAGYLAIAGAFLIVLGAIPAMCLIAGIVAWCSADHHFDAQQLGIGIGAVCTGFATVCGAVGLFRWGDKERAPSAPLPDSGSLRLVGSRGEQP